MTTPILFLLGAVALSALGGLIVWIASRPRPERFGSTIETFSRDLDALAPPGHPRSEQRTTHASPSNQTRRQPETSTAAKAVGPRQRPGPKPSRQSGQG